MKYLIEAKGNPHLTFFEGENMVNLLSRGNNFQALKLLLEKGVNANLYSDQMSPIHELVSREHTEPDTVYMYIAHGGNPRLKMAKKKLILFYFLLNFILNF